MIKKLAVVVFFFGTVIGMSVPVYSEYNAADPTDESIAVPQDEEMLPAEEGVGEGVITGDVTALDATAGSITVKGSDGAEKAFSVVDGETILWKGIEDIKLTDIKKSDKAEVGYYTDDAGKLVASWVDVIVPEQPVATGTQTAPVSSQPAEPAVPEAE
nr:hypothetical protein [Candidatus Omnitrophota bacterium]